MAKTEVEERMVKENRCLFFSFYKSIELILTLIMVICIYSPILFLVLFLQYSALFHTSFNDIPARFRKLAFISNRIYLYKY